MFPHLRCSLNDVIVSVHSSNSHIIEKWKCFHLKGGCYITSESLLIRKCLWWFSIIQAMVVPNYLEETDANSEDTSTRAGSSTRRPSPIWNRASAHVHAHSLTFTRGGPARVHTCTKFNLHKSSCMLIYVHTGPLLVQVELHVRTREHQPATHRAQFHSPPQPQRLGTLPLQSLLYLQFLLSSYTFLSAKTLSVLLRREISKTHDRQSQQYPS